MTSRRTLKEAAKAAQQPKPDDGTTAVIIEALANGQISEADAAEALDEIQQEQAIEGKKDKRGRPLQGAAKKAAERPKKDKTPKTPKPCLCGCGEQTGGGDFRPGHDAKYKSTLIKEALTGSNPEALATLEARGWTKFLDKAQEIGTRPKAEPRERKAKDDAKAIDQIGKLNQMKKAAQILQDVGRYGRKAGDRQISLEGANWQWVLDNEDRLRAFHAGEGEDPWVVES